MKTERKVRTEINENAYTRKETRKIEQIDIKGNRKWHEKDQENQGER